MSMLSLIGLGTDKHLVDEQIEKQKRKAIEDANRKEVARENLQIIKQAAKRVVHTGFEMAKKGAQNTVYNTQEYIPRDIEKARLKQPQQIIGYDKFGTPLFGYPKSEKAKIIGYNAQGQPIKGFKKSHKATKIVGYDMWNRPIWR